MKNKTITKPLAATALAMCCMLFTTRAQAQTINSIAGTGTAGYGGDGGAATLAMLRSPAHVKVDASGNIYIADYLNQRIRKIDASGNISTVAGSSGVGGFAGDGGPATAAQLFQPADVAIDGSGNIYISDYQNRRIRKVNTSGVISTVAGTGVNAYTGDGGPATAAAVGSPVGINTDAAGNVYFADEASHVVRKITVATGIITTLAGTGALGYSGDGGAATAAQLYQPKDVCLDAAGNIYIADYRNHRIRKINSSGTISTCAGGSSAGFSGDGMLAVLAKLNYPYAVTIDPGGNMFITDSWNNRIRRVNAAGVIHTYAGNGTYGFSGDGGAATAAKIGAAGITTDAAGNLYIADEGNHRLRKVNPPAVTISGTASVCIGSTTTLTASVSDGTWSSGTPANATVDAAGVVSGVAAGTAVISYVHYTGTATATVTVNPLPAAITGTAAVCSGSSTTLASTTIGGVWSSGATGTATVDASGNVSGVTGGTATISYTVAGCSATVELTVNNSPAAITGGSSVCIGNSLALSCATASGTWTSSNASVATIDGSGSCVGLAAGSANISYTLASGCNSTLAMTVNDCTASVGETGEVTNIEVFPNPCEGSLNISLPTNGKNAMVTIINMLGQTVYTAPINGKYVQINDLKAGCYSLKVTCNEQIYSQRIIVK